MGWGLITGPCGVCDICGIQWGHKLFCKNQPRRKAFWRFIKHRKIIDLIDVLFWKTIEKERMHWYYEPFVRHLETAKNNQWNKMHSSLIWTFPWQRMTEDDGFDIHLFFSPIKGTGSDGHGFGRGVEKERAINKTVEYWRKLQNKEVSK